MSAYKLASRYAKSLIGLAKEKGQLEEVYTDVKQLKKNIEGNRELKLMFKSPVIKTDKKIKIITEIYKDTLNPITFGFLRLITSKGRESYIPEMVDAFTTRYNNENSITKLTIKTAVEVSESILTKLKSALNTGAGESLDVKTEVDKDLIGGFVLSYEHKLYDASIATSLAELKQDLIDDSYIKKL